jgi:hypothetical protein
MWYFGYIKGIKYCTYDNKDLISGFFYNVFIMNLLKPKFVAYFIGRVFSYHFHLWTDAFPRINVKVRKQYLLPLPQASMATFLVVHLYNQANSSTYTHQSLRLGKTFSSETSNPEDTIWIILKCWIEGWWKWEWIPTMFKACLLFRYKKN